MNLDEVRDVVGILPPRVDERVEEDFGASVADENSRPMIRVVRLQHVDDAAHESTDSSAIILRSYFR